MAPNTPAHTVAHMDDEPPERELLADVSGQSKKIEWADAASEHKYVLTHQIRSTMKNQLNASTAHLSLSNPQPSHHTPDLNHYRPHLSRLLKFRIKEEIVTKLMILALAITLSDAVRASAQTIVNGSFETPGFATASDSQYSFYYGANSLGFGVGYLAWLYTQHSGQTYLDGWKVSGGGIDYFKSNQDFVHASDGSYFIDLVASGPQGGIISQDVSGLVPGTNYYLFFDVNQGVLGPATTITATAGASSMTVVNSTFGEWQTHTLRFTATAPTETISFSAPQSGAQDQGVFIDNIRIDKQSNGADRLVPSLVTGIQVQGLIGARYRVEYTTDLAAGTWNVLTRVTLTNSPAWIYDSVQSTPSMRFYRSVQE